jgi:hypothetical protein
MSYSFGKSIVTDGLVFYVDAGNDNSYPGSGGTWSDLIGGNDGSFNNMDDINNPSNNYNSANGGSIVFDGTNDYVSFSNFTSVASTGTVCQWFKPAISWSNSNPSQHIRLSGVHTNWEFGRTNASVGTGAFTFDLGTAESVTTLQTTWSNTLWYNMVVTWDTSANTSKVYVGGILDNTGTATNSTSTGTFEVGRSPGGLTQLWYGNIASVKYYNRVLTATEITQNYNALKNRFI